MVAHGDQDHDIALHWCDHHAAGLTGCLRFRCMRCSRTGRASHAQRRRAWVCRGGSCRPSIQTEGPWPTRGELESALTCHASRNADRAQRIDQEYAQPRAGSISCSYHLHQVAKSSRSDRPVVLFNLWQGELARKTTLLSAGAALWRACTNGSIAHLGRGHDVWSLISPEGDIPDRPDVLVEQQGCLRDACGVYNERAEALMKERPPIVSHFIHAETCNQHTLSG